MFGPETRNDDELIPIPPSLTVEIAQLCASLGITTESGAKPYNPDAFVQAIKRQHQTLVEVKAMLTKQNLEQAAREKALSSREKAVQFREERAAAYETLKALDTPTKRRWLPW